MRTYRIFSSVTMIALVLTDLLAGELLAVELGSRPGFALENGDTNGDLDRDLSDGIYLFSNLFLDGPAPVPLALCGTTAPAIQNGDSNGDGVIDISDPLHLLNWLFSDGPEPASACVLGDPRVIPIVADAFETSYAELAAAWWEWTWSVSSDRNPESDPTGEHCDVGQSGKVWFLTGTQDGTANRTCTVPAGRAIFFPLITVNTFCPFPDETDQDLRDQAREFMDVAIEMEATIDGVSLEKLSDFRVESTLFAIPAGEIVEEFAPECAGTDAVADGFWLLLPPLSEGSHVIQFSAFQPAFDHTLYGPIPEFGLDVTYKLEVAGTGD